MATPWSLERGDWQVAWPQRVSQHDLVYLSPPDDPVEGLPIGNGEFGAMLWVEDSRVVLALNKVDTWDDGPPGHFHGWSGPAEETHTALRGCGRLILDFGLPVWDWLYLRDFRGGLHLANAEAHLMSDTPFGNAQVRAYGSNLDQVLVVRAQITAAERLGHDVTLERIGSRTLGHWYLQAKRDATIGLAGTQMTVERKRLVLHQKLSTLDFVVVAALVPDDAGAVEASLRHSRAGRFSMGPACTLGYTIYVAAVTSENADDPLAEAHARLDAAIARGEVEVARRHAEQWRELWQRAFIHLSDIYLADVWHLTLYLAASSCRGTQPPHFCAGLWRYMHDFVPWYFHFHWNMQWAWWQLHPAGVSELMRPYLEYRSRQLPLAIDFAQQTHGVPGALYADVADRRGYQDLDTQLNHTPGAQIAMLFWRHYRFTGDRKVLRDQAFEVMWAVTEWYLHTLHQADDGYYHPIAGHVYESNVELDDPITDLAMLRVLLPAVIEAAQLLNDPRVDVARLKNVLANLVPFQFAELQPAEQAMVHGQNVHRGGLGEGVAVASPKVLFAGYDPKANRWLRKRICGRGIDGDYYGIPDPELCLVFPAGLVGLKDRGSDLFNALVTQVRLHPVPHHDETSPDSQITYDCMGWCPMPVVCARLGLKEHMRTVLQNQLNVWQLYPQGLGHYGPLPGNVRDKTRADHLNHVRDAEHPDTTVAMAGWKFRHFSNEAVPIASVALTEMLLQSHDGVLRIAPALPVDMDACFTLTAEGGVKVSAEVRRGIVQWVWLDNREGCTLHLESPWPTADQLYLWEKPAAADDWQNATPQVIKSVRGKSSGWDLEIAVAPHGAYLLGPRSTLVVEWQTCRLEVRTNDQPRRLQQAILGKERYF